jgi:hypothetical protein
MSAFLGVKQTWPFAVQMSAYNPKADIEAFAALTDVRSCLLIQTRMVEGTLPNRHRLPRGANKFDLFASG